MLQDGFSGDLEQLFGYAEPRSLPQASREYGCYRAHEQDPIRVRRNGGRRRWPGWRCRPRRRSCRGLIAAANSSLCATSAIAVTAADRTRKRTSVPADAYAGTLG